MSILWTILVGFVAGLLAKLIFPGDREPSGFILTTVLGIIGAVVANYLGRVVGFYDGSSGAGLIGSTIGAVIVLFLWGLLSERKP